jgi:hypothetical protein
LKTTERGQAFILVAFFMILIFFFIIVISDLFQIYLKKQELNRVADYAAKSGMIVVGDMMMTQAVDKTGFGISGQGENDESSTDPYAGHTENINVDLTGVCSNGSSWATLTAPPLRTAVAVSVLDHISEYHLDGELSYQPDIRVDYPYQCSSAGSGLRLYLTLGQQIELTFPSLRGDQRMVIYGESEQVIYCP